LHSGTGVVERGTGTIGSPWSEAKSELVTANLKVKSRIDFSLPKTLIGRHEFITGKSIIKTIASRRRPKG
jgi:hypothetical protein